jgi:hypothetical protein
MPPEAQQQEEETSIRDDFESAIAAVENDDDTAITNETKADAEEQTTAEELRADDGEETPEAKAEAKVEAEAVEAIEDKTGDDPVADATPPADANDKAPASWTPAAREGWAELSDAVKQQVAKREHEIDKALNEGAEHRKTGAAFQGIADRYAQVFAAEGAPDPITGIEELIKTVTTLRMGSAEQKAQKVAGFIAHYGIDVPMLDDILSGNPAAPAADDPLTKMLNERLKPVDNLLARMDETARNSQFQKNQDAINEVMTFKQDPAHEFYDDVKNDMADMVEMAEKRGVIMPLQEAYDKACALNPEIAKIVTKRDADQRLIDSGKTLEEKRNAASSISGKQGGVTDPNPDGLTMRQQIEAGFDAQTG